MTARGRNAVALPALAHAEMDVADVYQEHAAAVSAWARRLLGPWDDVEDVVHEVFLVVQRKFKQWRGDAQITTWLYAITVRVVQQRRRRARVRSWLGFASPHEALHKEAETPLQALETRRVAETTYRIMEQLSERDRSALILFELEGLSGQEVASITGDSLATVWVRLHRARDRFRKAFERLEQGASASRKRGRDR